MSPPAIVLTLATSIVWSATPSVEAGPPVALVGLRQEPEDPGVRDAAAAFEEGESAYARHEYGAAVEAFREAQRLAPHPYTEYNLALALARDDREIEAWRIFERLAEEAPEPDQQNEAAQQLATLRTQLSSIQVVTADGKPVCVDGLRHDPRTERIMRPGTVRVERPGFEENVELRPGESRVFDLRYTDPPPPKDESPPRAVGPLLAVAAVSATAATGAAVVAAVENRRSLARGWSYGAAGASAVAVGTVVAALTLHFRSKRRRESNARARPTPSAEVNCPPPDTADVIVRTVP
jgi:hypothetical protein